MSANEQTIAMIKWYSNKADEMGCWTVRDVMCVLMTPCAGVWLCISSCISVHSLLMVMRFIPCAHTSHYISPVFSHTGRRLNINCPHLHPPPSLWKPSTNRHLWALWFVPKTESRWAARPRALWHTSRGPPGSGRTLSHVCGPSHSPSSPMRRRGARERSPLWSRGNLRVVVHHFINNVILGGFCEGDNWYESICFVSRKKMLGTFRSCYANHTTVICIQQSG